MCYGRLCGNPVSLVLCIYTVIHSTSIQEKIIAKSSYLSSRHSHPIIHSGTVIASVTPAFHCINHPGPVIVQSPQHSHRINHPGTVVASITPAQASHQSPRHIHCINHLGTVIVQSPRYSQRINHPGIIIAWIIPASHHTNHPSTVIASITPAQSSHQSSWHSHHIDRHANTITLSQFTLLWISV